MVRCKEVAKEVVEGEGEKLEWRIPAAAVAAPNPRSAIQQHDVGGLLKGEEEEEEFETLASGPLWRFASERGLLGWGLVFRKILSTKHGAVFRGKSRSG